MSNVKFACILTFCLGYTKAHIINKSQRYTKTNIYPSNSCFLTKLRKLNIDVINMPTAHKSVSTALSDGIVRCCTFDVEFTSLIHFCYDDEYLYPQYF